MLNQSDFQNFFEAIGTPAQPPQRRGKSPGWPEGQPRSRRIRYPSVKKVTKKTKTTLKVALIL